jgi:hypothetical protein
MIGLRAPDRLPALPMSTDERPRTFGCLKCGAQLHTHALRTEPNAAGQTEKVQIYMCYQHGFFTHRKSTGLVPGL